MQEILKKVREQRLAAGLVVRSTAPDGRKNELSFRDMASRDSYIDRAVYNGYSVEIVH